MFLVLVAQVEKQIEPYNDKLDSMAWPVFLTFNSIFWSVTIMECAKLTKPIKHRSLRAPPRTGLGF